MRVAIADDAVLLREGIARLLGDAGFEVVATYGDAEALLDGLETTPVDVCVLDIKMPPTFTDEGLRAAAAIRSRWPQVGVLVLSQYVELGLALPLLADGAEGLGLPAQGPGHRRRRVRRRRPTRRRGRLRPRSHGGVPAARAEADGRRPEPTDASEHLVLEAMAQGLSNPAIAGRLQVSVRAVEKHVTNIFDKLDLAVADDSDRRVLAVLRFLRGVVRAAVPGSGPAHPTSGRGHAPCRHAPAATSLSQSLRTAAGQAERQGHDHQHHVDRQPDQSLALRPPLPDDGRRDVRRDARPGSGVRRGRRPGGYADPWVELPVVSALVMAINMTVPMVLLMLRHGHGGRAILGDGRVHGRADTSQPWASTGWARSRPTR